jgi:hypothetical protein
VDKKDRLFIWLLKDADYSVFTQLLKMRMREAFGRLIGRHTTVLLPYFIYDRTRRPKLNLCHMFYLNHTSFYAAYDDGIIGEKRKLFIDHSSVPQLFHNHHALQHTSSISRQLGHQDEVYSNTYCDMEYNDNICEDSFVSPEDMAYPELLADIGKKVLCYDGPLPLLGGTTSWKHASLLSLYLNGLNPFEAIQSKYRKYVELFLEFLGDQIKLFITAAVVLDYRGCYVY